MRLCGSLCVCVCARIVGCPAEGTRLDKTAGVRTSRPKVRLPPGRLSEAVIALSGLFMFGVHL